MTSLTAGAQPTVGTDSAGNRKAASTLNRAHPTRPFGPPLSPPGGYTSLIATFQAWWKKWQKHGGRTDPIPRELLHIASARASLGGEPTLAVPSDALAAWLASLGGPERLTADQAAAWLGAWYGMQRATQAAHISLREAGPTVERAPTTRANRAGRAIYGRSGALNRVTLPDGSVLERPRTRWLRRRVRRGALRGSAPPPTVYGRGRCTRLHHRQPHRTKHAFPGRARPAGPPEERAGSGAWCRH